MQKPPTPDNKGEWKRSPAHRLSQNLRFLPCPSYFQSFCHPLCGRYPSPDTGTKRNPDGTYYRASNSQDCKSLIHFISLLVLHTSLFKILFPFLSPEHHALPKLFLSFHLCRYCYMIAFVQSHVDNLCTMD